MSKQHYDPSRQFQTIAETSRTTGLSQYYIRCGCRGGTVPHIKSGSKFMVNVPLLIEQMNRQSLNSNIRN